MKTLACLIFTLSLLFPWAGKAQNTIGVKGGMNYSWAKPGNEMEDIQPIYGYNAGIYSNFFIYDYFYIQSELLLSQKGYTYFDGRYHVKRTFGYMEIPVLAKGVYQNGKQSSVTYYLAAGPCVGYALYGRESTDDYFSFHELVFTQDYIRTEFSGLATLGTEISLGFGFLNIEARYYYGLTASDKINKPKNNVIGLCVGFSYFKGRRGISHRKY